MKNPKWHRDEIILALALYFQADRGSIDARNHNIIQLSEELNLLPIFTERPDAERFRNPNGVSLKLSNFLAIDPSYPGKGMASYSQLDKAIFEEFVDDKERLFVLAQQIRSIVHDETLRRALSHIEDDETTTQDSVNEGQVLYKLHNTERARRRS